MKNIIKILNHINASNIKKLKISKIPIVYNNKKFIIKKIFTYDINLNANESLKMKTNEKYKSNSKVHNNLILIIQEKNGFSYRKSNYVVGKILANVSSDFLSLIAQKLKAKNLEKYKDYKLIQYPMQKYDYSKRLLMLKFFATEISVDDIINAIIDMNEFQIDFLKLLKSIIPI